MGHRKICFSSVAGVVALLRSNIYPLGDTERFHKESSTMTHNPKNTERIGLTADVISAYVSNNPVPISELPSLIEQIHRSMAGLSNGSATKRVERLTPAVPIKKSVTPEYIVCLDNGKKFKSMKRHLMAAFGITSEEYRAKWNLPSDYPMVAPAYAAARSELAKKMGLGRKPDGAEPIIERKKAA
jgi:predicted transcriptional regulator